PAGGGSLTLAPLRADERVVHFLKGLNQLDPRLDAALAPFESSFGDTEDDLGERQHGAFLAIRARWQQEEEPSLILLTGPDAEARQIVARHAARKAGLQPLRLPLDALPTAPAEVEALARLWERESRLLPLALIVDADDFDPAHADRAAALRRFLANTGGAVILSAREPVERPGRESFLVETARPAAAEQEQRWHEGLGLEERAGAARLAAQFDFNFPVILRLAEEAVATAGSAPRVERAWDLARARATRRLGDLAQRLELKATWDDLVLPEARLDLLRQVAGHVRHRGVVQGHWGFAARMNRGLGVSALFAGDSGTGKTMAAEVLAGDLRLDLYRIDLSAVVSKYIGETEKNLRRLFDAAEGGGVILFFDEADALFGRRSEVKDSHDRYANIEINYLLQRLEAYRGVAVLATNQRTAMDEAFVRRLRFIVEFPVPDLALRRRLWERAFPRPTDTQPGVPLERLDPDRLARLNLTGGSILNIALNAAFRAAAAGTSVTMPLVLAAARDELEKLQRPFNPADFVWREPAPRVAKPLAA
ncbi:MAG: ATP-binding protein, partial [Limisphaerales bacterium]